MNQLAIINGDLQIYQTLVEDDPILDAVVARTFELAKALRSGETDGFEEDVLSVLGDDIRRTLRYLIDTYPDLYTEDDPEHMMAQFETYFEQFMRNVAEYRSTLTD